MLPAWEMGLSRQFSLSSIFLLPLALQEMNLRPLVPSRVFASQHVPRSVQ